MPERVEKPIHFLPKTERRENLSKCCQCQRLRTRRRVHTLNGVTPICKNCLPAFRQCHECSRYGVRQVVPFSGPNDTYICIQCAPDRRMCTLGCGREGTLRVPGQQHTPTAFMCDTCWRTYFICIRCLRSTHRRYRVPQRTDRVPDNICTNCWAAENTLIKDAGFKGFRAPIGEGPLYFGVELETEVIGDNHDREDVAQLIHERVGEFCVMKGDGSLRNGIEIVSCPCTFEVHRTIWERLFKPMIPRLRSWESGRCGIHIHISRAPVQRQHFGRMLVLVNSSENHTLITAIAGRDNGTYCNRRPKSLESASQSWQKYEALNNCHDATYELRIFRGTLNYESFLKNVEFASALVEYCRDNDLKIEQVRNPEPFLEWLKDHREQYPNLNNFLVRRGFLQKPRGVELPPETIEV